MMVNKMNYPFFQHFLEKLILLFVPTLIGQYVGCDILLNRLMELICLFLLNSRRN